MNEPANNIVRMRLRATDEQRQGIVDEIVYHIGKSGLDLQESVMLADEGFKDSHGLNGRPWGADQTLGCFIDAIYKPAMFVAAVAKLRGERLPSGELLTINVVSERLQTAMASLGPEAN
jgi:hypothetical protein